jgi:hypothetical protein
MGTLSVRYSERFVTRFGARTAALRRRVLMAVALVLLAVAPANASYVTQLLRWRCSVSVLAPAPGAHRTGHGRGKAAPGRTRVGDL